MPDVKNARVERPPRDNLVRAMALPPELRKIHDDEDDDDRGMPTLFGHFAVFNQWTEIDSMWEGNFMERIAPGAFKKTIKENRDSMKVLFNHGQDMQIGDKVLGPIEVLREDKTGPFYEVPLFDTTYNRDLAPGLEAGVYGASFRFRVMKEEFDKAPKTSKANPTGLPERTIKEAQVMEFGPVTFPAYAGASADARTTMLRSLTDNYVLGELVRDPDRLKEILEQTSERDQSDALSEGAGETHSEDESREELDGEGDGDETNDPEETSSEEDGLTEDVKEPEEVTHSHHEEEYASRSTTDTKEKTQMPGSVKTIDELRARDVDIQARFTEIHNEFGASVLPEEVRAEWENLIGERNEGRRAIADFESRTKQLAAMAVDEARHEPVMIDDARNVNRNVRRRNGVPDNIFAVEEYRGLSSSMDELKQGFRDGAALVLERTSIAHPRADEATARTQVLRLLDTKDSDDGILAQRIISTGSPAYQRAWSKSLKGSPLTSEEQRALSLGADADGGFAVPFQLDPTVILTSDGVINPIRTMARIEQIIGKEWQGITTDGVTVTRTTESDEATDDSPTLAQPVVRANRVQGFIPFSIEIGQDWGSLQSEMAVLLSDAKDVEESDAATGFILGDGVGINAGGIIGSLDSGSAVTTVGDNAFAVADLYKLEENVPPRFRARAQMLANKAIYNKVRQFDTSGGADLWVRLEAGKPGELIGYPAPEASAMDSTVADATEIILMGDFRFFLIVDRIGMSIELIPHLFGASGRPTGQRGIYAIWRNNSVILVDNAFRLLTVQ